MKDPRTGRFELSSWQNLKSAAKVQENCEVTGYTPMGEFDIFPLWRSMYYVPWSQVLEALGESLVKRNNSEIFIVRFYGGGFAAWEDKEKLERKIGFGQARQRHSVIDPI